MQYENRSVTRDGTALLAQSVNNAKPIIDKMLVLNSDIPLNKTVDTMTLSDFNNALSFDVNNVSQNDNSFTASAVITNDGITQDYPAQLIGITGYLDGSNDKKLFAVAQASDPFVIEKQNGTPIKFVPSLTFGFSNSNNVQLTVKNDVYITKADLEKMGFAKKEDLNELNKTINESISGPNSTVSQNINAMGAKANQYTDEQLKDYTSTADLNAELGGKQPIGDYATTQQVKQYELNSRNYADSKIKFFNSLDEVNSSPAPEGTIAIVKG